jgi:tRNA dimethylallyltransferase
MQLYHGLPIITNKITHDEMKGVPHHLLGCIGLEEETWTVGKFVQKSLEVIDEIRSRGKLPVLVGGTHYYTQSLLFQDALPDELIIQNNNSGERFPILDEPTDVIREKLREVDPVMADRWHPNERRKIQRSLEIYLKTGKPASQIYGEQRLGRESSPHAADSEVARGPGLRFPTLVLWVHASKDALYPRLDARIGKMLDGGLLSEVETLTNFRLSYEARKGEAVDQSRGIWVSIGYKEFLEYQTALSEQQVSDTDLEKVKTAAVEKTQAATRQYANRQLRWIRIKLLNALFGADQKSNVFLLDGSDLSEWENNVLTPSCDITEKFLAGLPLPNPTEVSPEGNELLNPKREYDLGQRPDLWQTRICDTCGTVAVTENDWKLHSKSRGHRRAVGAKKKQENAQLVKPKDKQTAQAELVDILETYQKVLGNDESPK